MGPYSELLNSGYMRIPTRGPYQGHVVLILEAHRLMEVGHHFEVELQPLLGGP